MKDDITITFLNFVLALLVIACVCLTLLTLSRQHSYRQLTTNAKLAGTQMMRANALLNDVVAYNARAKSPELTQILQLAQPKPAH